jgi:hypothetical protein
VELWGPRTLQFRLQFVGREFLAMRKCLERRPRQLRRPRERTCFCGRCAGTAHFMKWAWCPTLTRGYFLLGVLAYGATSRAAVRKGHSRGALSTEDEVFRWQGPALLAILSHTVDIDSVRSEICRCAEKKWEKTFVNWLKPQYVIRCVRPRSDRLSA